jgi:hypothetical protein
LLSQVPQLLPMCWVLQRVHVCRWDVVMTGGDAFALCPIMPVLRADTRGPMHAQHLQNLDTSTCNINLTIFSRDQLPAGVYAATHLSTLYIPSWAGT